MNKKLIRLTELDLHRIVKESVNKVLNEMDYSDLRKAYNDHYDLMNKVDPRTFANRARGVNAQGRQRNDDTDAMYDEAAKAWNSRFGFQRQTPDRGWFSSYNHNANSEAYDKKPKEKGFNHKYLRMSDRPSDNYRIHDYEHIRDGNGIETYDDHFYYPKDGRVEREKGKFNYKDDLYDSSSKRELSNEKERPYGYDVAQQMAQGNGKYDPNKGWQ